MCEHSEDGWTAGNARAVLLDAIGGGTFDVHMVLNDVAKYCSVATSGN
jgi:hypothetical protein